MHNIKNISITDYHYELPEERIALHPLEERDQSKLLVWKDNHITEEQFLQMSRHIPEGSLMIFNNSKVIRARLLFEKTPGSFIEIFCLEPIGAGGDYAKVLNAQKSTAWKCMVGGLSKWKSGALQMSLVINQQQVVLQATLLRRGSEAHEIEFKWDTNEVSFGEILESAGDIPLPPYIKRQTIESDKHRYQTIYANKEGSVAAPTAGLHFTDRVFEKLKEKNVEQAYVSLHVGAGTFKPVKAATMEGHEMHSEWTAVSIGTIRQLIQHNICRIAVGTTSLRTIESLYWLGAKVKLNPDIENLHLNQWEIYESPLQECNISAVEALESLASWMEAKQMETLYTSTKLLIAPGYRFRIADAIVTNFHQPESTLLLLVAAAIGDQWKSIYQYAMEHQFRFLSYGDSSLIFIQKEP